MTTQKQFLMIPFAFYDAGVPSVVGATEITVFMILRRFTWRGRPGCPEEYQLKSDGKLYSRIKQSKLAEVVGCSRQTINKSIAALKSLRWVDVVVPKDRWTALYVTGEYIKDSNGLRHEAFYFDSWLSDLWDHLEMEAIREFGEPKPLESEDELAQTDVRSSIDTTSISWRVQKTREYIVNGGGVVANSDKGCQVDDTTHLSSVPEATGVVNSALQGLSSQHDTRNTEPPTEKEEGRETLSAPPARERESWDDPEADPDSVSPEFYDCCHEEESVHVDAGSRVGRLEEYREKASKRARAARSEQQEKERANEQRQKNLQSKGPSTGQIKELEKIWIENMKLVFPDKKPARWVGKERGQAKKLIDMYDFATVKEALQYVVCKWEEVNERFLKGNGSYPTIGFLLSMHGVLMLEAQGSDGVTRVEKEIEEWRRENPNVARTPAHLKEKLARAKRNAGQ